MQDWEQLYVTGDTRWEKGGPSPGLLEYLGKSPLTGRVLVPGCGFGHDVRAIARSGAEVVGLDIAPTAISQAESFPKTGRESYSLADLFALPESFQKAFDWVWEHTCFCAIPRELRPDYVRAVAGALKPGGHLLAMFYLDPGNAQPSDGPPFETTLAELDRLFGAKFELLKEWPPGVTHPGREKREWMRLYRVRS